MSFYTAENIYMQQIPSRWKKNLYAILTAGVYAYAFWLYQVVYSVYLKHNGKSLHHVRYIF